MKFLENYISKSKDLITCRNPSDKIKLKLSIKSSLNHKFTEVSRVTPISISVGSHHFFFVFFVVSHEQFIRYKCVKMSRNSDKYLIQCSRNSTKKLKGHQKALNCLTKCLKCFKKILIANFDAKN